VRDKKASPRNAKKYPQVNLKKQLLVRKNNSRSLRKGGSPFEVLAAALFPPVVALFFNLGQSEKNAACE
jgi:hypothetical protein